MAKKWVIITYCTLKNTTSHMHNKLLYTNIEKERTYGTLKEAIATKDHWNSITEGLYEVIHIKDWKLIQDINDREHPEAKALHRK
jgi:hypothetical protein